MNTSANHETDTGLANGVGVGGFRRRNWVTMVALVMVAFMAYASVQNALDSERSSIAERTTGGVIFGIGAVAVLVGMWLLREGRAKPVACAFIIVPVLFTGVVFYWLLFVPTTLAAVILVGVLSGGLGRELRHATPQPAS